MHDCARVFLTGETAHTVKKGLLTADCFILGGGLGGGGGKEGVGNCNWPHQSPKTLGCIIGDRNVNMWVLARRQQRNVRGNVAAALPCAPRARRCVTAVPSC